MWTPRYYFIIKSPAGGLREMFVENMPDKISVVINTYNAAKHLDKVLDSLSEFDEVLICDMESTDNTCQIAENHGCRVLTFPKGEHKICEPARDFAIHAAKHQWVLVVDADEIIPETLRQYLYKSISDSNFNYALAIPRINLFMGIEAHGTPDYQLRFFRKDRTSWAPVIHARPTVLDEIKFIPDKRQLSIHHLDDPTISQRVCKMNTYTDYEIPKRCHKKYSTASILFRPFWFFIKNLFIGGGIRDGRRGIIKAYMASIYQIILLAKLFEYNLKLHEVNDPQNNNQR